MKTPFLYQRFGHRRFLDGSFEGATTKNTIFSFTTKKAFTRTMENVTRRDSRRDSFEDRYVHKDYIR